ncbi:conserved hypothetical protein [Histoplasma capsulatum G186AR]|uniref:Cytochrome b561 domain-containing protein n=2 Tax=Ajellomyces capsulatus TaxID=5037 RepID=C0NAL9_AJECG|nr:uncharacterized protein HCBG_00165 [Histoplasma capsulatum G186AR]EEH10710.1 conserved hypothetical protein [Histoplasma capsulatum G186AR]KAG5288601.1 cytochrome b-561 / ferric reductase transmembrane domain-containing protein [Histoplasma capsulatum]QSS71176.1 cytochrome b-561 / ferric reductase transmembrane domain-containing protein [Histoplasma capsulatum G186AR]
MTRLDRYLDRYRLTSIYVLILFFAAFVLSEPVQYCRFGHRENGPSEVDFCMGVTMHYNVSSNHHDMYLTMEIPRESALGWTAIGTGSSMKGSLMVIVYGNPSDQHDPIVSIRTVDGHSQPKLVSQDQMGGTDLRVLQASWVQGTRGMTVAKIALVCLSCEKWPGAPISAQAPSQPWIWAWNDNQDFQVFSYDAHLRMHKHHAKNGGWGVFYVDMARSVSTVESAPSLPPIRTGISRLGTSDSPTSAGGLVSSIRENVMQSIHGFVMFIAFFILFPLGTIAMRSGSSKSFKYHWSIQLVAALFAWSGAIIGLLMDHNINTLHQWIGVFLGAYLFIQGLLGWQHHRVFVRIRRRHWVSYSHIWFGRLTLVLGWTNIITGMLLSGTSTTWIASMAGLIAVNALVLSFWIWKASRRQLRTKVSPADEAASQSLWPDPKQGEYFALGTIDEDDGTDSEGERENKKNNRAPYDPVRESSGQ